MERRAIKRKAPVMSSVPNKRRCPRNSGVPTMEKLTCSGPSTLLMLIIGAQDSYMKEALGLYQFINTCVPDTLLASFHILYIKHLHIRDLLMSNYFIKILMIKLNGAKYNHARALWIQQLVDFNKCDRFSNIKDHFPVIDKLVYAKVDYHQETPSDHPVYKKTLSKFRIFGDLRAMGDPISGPALILVHRDVYNPRYGPCMHNVPPLAVVDDDGSDRG
ncbi:uncharacterized protein LOC132872264 isoform X2 [Neoarius graeffei]|uniref:uncharacterized protein LOC132872264 isoform X2 n=1 Tax=Neoarius graeffei TaxID=443677 RepID=UPI00298BD7F6|nr:uncharacterized protein LOC132872264 isoform X2 [Neoarius graeffei]